MRYSMPIFARPLHSQLAHCQQQLSLLASFPTGRHAIWAQPVSAHAGDAGHSAPFDRGLPLRAQRGGAGRAALCAGCCCWWRGLPMPARRGSSSQFCCCCRRLSQNSSPAIAITCPAMQESLVGPHVADAPSEVGGSSLKFANYFYPDAESLGGVRVVCACGDTVRGRRLWGSSSSNGSSAEDTYSSPGSDSYASYASVGSMDDGGVKGSCGSVGGANRYDAWLAYESYKVIRVSEQRAGFVAD